MQQVQRSTILQFCSGTCSWCQNTTVKISSCHHQHNLSAFKDASYLSHVLLYQINNHPPPLLSSIMCRKSCVRNSTLSQKAEATCLQYVYRTWERNDLDHPYSTSQLIPNVISMQLTLNTIPNTASGCYHWQARVSGHDHKI